MSCAIANPAFADTTPVGWNYGISPQGTTGTAQAMAGTTGDRWGITSFVLNLRPGTYTFSQIVYALKDTQTGNLDSVLLCFCTKSGNTLTVQATVDLTSQQSRGSGVRTTTATISQSITIASGEAWHLALMIHGPTGRTLNTPSFVQYPAAGNGPADGALWNNSGLVSGAVGSPPTSFSTTTADSAATQYQLVKLTFTTTTNCVANLATFYTGSTKAIAVPYRTLGITWFSFEGVVVADGNNVDIEFARNNEAAGGTLTTVSYMSVDMGATDRMRFGPIAAALVNVNLAGAGAEAGDTFDIAVYVRPPVSGLTDSRSNMFWHNRTTGQGPTSSSDWLDISHAAKSTTTRYAAEPSNSGYTGYTHDGAALRPVEFLRVAGTGTITRCKVGYRMIVGGIASNMGTGSYTPQRLGSGIKNYINPLLPNASDDLYFNTARPNQPLLRGQTGLCQPYYTRFKNSTPGAGDVTDMLWNALFIFGDAGGNDLKADGGTTGDVGTTNATTGISTVGQRDQRCAELVWKMAEMVADIKYNGNERNNEVLIVGMAPYHDPSLTPGIQDDAFKQWTQGMEGVAAASRSFFYNPFTLVENNLATYQESDGVHYTEPEGGTAVALAALAARSLNKSGCTGNSGSSRSGVVGPATHGSVN